MLRQIAANQGRRRGGLHCCAPAAALSHAVLAADHAALSAILGQDKILFSPDERMDRYCVDWLQQYNCRAAAVAFPSSPATLSALMQYCFDHRLSVVPQGGNTGLVGGSVPRRSTEIIISLERMRAIRHFDTVAGVLVAEAGATLASLEDAAAEAGWAVPLDLASRSTCTIGGNVATNAGGLRFIRFGSLKASVLGLEVVCADGTILECLSLLRKDNVGYDLKQLFIGSEGTLGVISAVALQLQPRSTVTNVAAFAVRSFDDAVRLLAVIRVHCAEIISAVEFCDAAAVGFARTLHANQRRHCSSGSSSSDGGSGDDAASTDASERAFIAAPFVVLLETKGSNAAHDAGKLGQLLEAVLADGLVTDGVVAQSASQAAALWSMRDDVTAAISKRGHTFKYDLSFPVASMYDIVEDVRGRLAGILPGVIVVGFGHLADGNVHLNVSVEGRDPSAVRLVQARLDAIDVYSMTIARGGSISAEHGLGQAKAGWLSAARSPAVVHLMRTLKQTLDLRGVLPDITGVTGKPP